MGKKVLIISTSLSPNANSEILARETVNRLGETRQ